MVRGRCVFITLNDIIQTVLAIKEYVANNQSTFRIIEIESRFGLEIPISDVTLKIAIKEEVIGELQLTLQSNAAQYHFAHIVYELQRSTIFTKTKMVDNKYKELEQ